MIVGVCWILKHSYILGLRKEPPCLNQKYHSFSLCSKTIYEQELSQCLDGHWRSIGTPKSPKETPCYFMAYQRNFQSCLSVHRGSPCGHYPGCIGPHSKPPRPWSWSWPPLQTSDIGLPWPCLPPDMEHGDPSMLAPLLVTSGGHYWRSVQTCL